MKCGICGKEMIKLADGVNYGCDYCNIQTLLYRPNTDISIDRNQQKYDDLLNKESSELLINSLAEKDKKIAELQKQLEEKEKIIEHWHNLYQERDKQFQSIRQRYHLLNRLQSNYDEKDKLYLSEMQCLELVEENEKLKQQLHSQPAEIVEKIKNLAGDYWEEQGYGFVMDSNDFIEMLDVILKEYQK